MTAPTTPAEILHLLALRSELGARYAEILDDPQAWDTEAQGLEQDLEALDAQLDHLPAAHLRAMAAWVEGVAIDGEILVVEDLVTAWKARAEATAGPEREALLQGVQVAEAMHAELLHLVTRRGRLLELCSQLGHG